jgi:hypothetical protein
MRMRAAWVAKAIVLVIAGFAVLTLVVMSLWNALLPELFHVPRVGFWQAAGLLLLSRILFGHLIGRGGHGGWRHRKWRERWESMTPEERARLRERMGRCGLSTTSATTQPDAAQPPQS